jgi:putative chitinase
MDLTLHQLKQILPNNTNLADWHEALTSILPEYEINTPERIAAFLAQCVHESGGFSAIKENLNYKAASLQKVFPKYFPTSDLAEDYAHQPEKIANRVYANRMGNGDEASGDGYRYCGRGLIQLTGHDNYLSFADSIETPLEEMPEYLATFAGAIQSACWFWECNDLNSLADTGDIKAMTKRINGGYIGLEDRMQHYEHIKAVLGCGS